MYRLIFLDGKMKGRRIAVQQGSIVIGRDPACHVDIAEDDEVSRQHATIEDRNGTYFIKDMGAVNKPVVNGVAVIEAELKHGDLIEVGRTKLEFQIIQDHAPIGVKRRLSHLQVLAAVAVGIILLGELCYVFVLPTIRKPADIDLAAHERSRQERIRQRDASNRSSVVVLEGDENVSRARSLIAAATNEPAVEVAFTSPVPPSAFEPIPQIPAVPMAFPEVVVAVPTNDVPALTAAAATSAPPVVAVVTTPVPKPTPHPEDPLAKAARDMLASAKAKAEAGDLAQADQTLDRIQIMTPDFLAAYIERAKLYEKREMYRMAGDQWAQVLNRSAGTPYYAEAAEARQRVARLELAQKAEKPKETEKPKADAKAQKKIRIMSVDREKFPSTREYDEMRIIRVNMRAKATDAIEAADVRVLVTFYDRNLGNDKPVVSRAVVPEDALRVDGRWGAGENKTVTATYIIPKDFRADETRRIDERRSYEGYRIQVFYKGELQDEDAMPRSLTELPAPRLRNRPLSDQPVGR